MILPMFAGAILTGPGLEPPPFIERVRVVKMSGARTNMVCSSSHVVFTITADGTAHPFTFAMPGSGTPKIKLPKRLATDRSSPTTASARADSGDLQAGDEMPADGDLEFPSSDEVPAGYWDRLGVAMQSFMPAATDDGGDDPDPHI